MKKILLGIILSALAVLSFQVSAERAFVIKEFDCDGFIPDPDTGEPIFPLFTTQTLGFAVEGRVGKITCHFDHDYPLEQASAARGWVCSVLSPTTGLPLYTDKTVMLATPDGKALLQCQFGPAGRPVD